jgi:O-methyltransferase
MLKSFCIQIMRHLGLHVVPTSQWDNLAESLVISDIHKNDAAELEQVYRAWQFPELPDHEDRAGLLAKLVGTSVGEAMYILNHLHLGLKVPGDICEFGVAQGATSRLLATEIFSSERHFWLFDSFEGLPAPTEKDRLIDDIFGLGSMAAYKGQMACPEVQVLAKLQEVSFPESRVHVRKGWVRDCLATGPLPKQVCFAYVDFDFYEPILDALQFLDRVMPVGGQIVVDDYGFFSEGAQTATDEFVVSQNGAYNLSLPVPSAGHFAILSKVS